MAFLELGHGHFLQNIGTSPLNKRKFNGAAIATAAMACGNIAILASSVKWSSAMHLADSESSYRSREADSFGQ
jgi:hypothetical protein